MTHATIFIKDSLQINENLASFVGDFGAEQFLKYKFGQQSEQLKKYQFQKRYREAYSDHVLRGATALDALYRSFKPNVGTAIKDTLKNRKIREIVQTTDTLLGGEARKYRQ
jgi:predicted aminopeptidase